MSDTQVTVRIEVEDTGVGIDEDVLPRLFQAFSQADTSTTRRYGGRGLGVAIVRRLSRLMGGDCGVRSTVGVGSCFWFTVSLEQVAASDLCAADEPTLRTEPPPPSRALPRPVPTPPVPTLPVPCMSSSRRTIWSTSS